MITSHRSRSPARAASSKRPARGQAIVEFTLIVPVLLLLLVGLADWARLYTTAIAVEAAAREAALYGGFDGSYWQETPVNNIPVTIEKMEARICGGTVNLVDHVGDAVQCTNPQWLASPWLPSTIASQSDAISAGILINPGGVPKCSSPGPNNPTCQVRIGLTYQFRMILGGVGIPGLFQFPASLPVTREVIMPVNDFPQAAP